MVYNTFLHEALDYASGAVWNGIVPYSGVPELSPEKVAFYDRETIHSPDLEEDIALYARVHVVWDNGNALITTSPVPLGFTY